MIIVLMGVSGSGKTTVGRKLAQALTCPFYDADDFHPEANKEKMAKGIPLTDEDRAPWLDTLRAEMGKWGKTQTVLACSALKQKYRDRLSAGNSLQWVYLKGDEETLRQRLAQRQGHFSGEKLLESQIKTFEEPGNALTVDIRQDPDGIVGQILKNLKGT